MLSYCIVVFSPILANAKEDSLIRFPPETVDSIRYDGRETAPLEKLLKFSKGFVKHAVTIDCPITLSLLRQLSECKQLEMVQFRR